MSETIDFGTLHKSTELKIWIYINEEIAERQINITNYYEKKNIVMVEPIMVNNHPIFLDSAQNKMVIVAYNENDKPMMYPKLVVKTIKNSKEKKSYYIVQIAANPVPFNRRNSFRCYVGMDVVARIGNNKMTYEVICKDISECGFSLIFNEEEHCEVGKTAHFVFTDSIGEMAAPDYQVYNLNLYGTCVRKQRLKNGKILFGFKQFSSNDLCRKYVFHKERALLNRL